MKATTDILLSPWEWHKSYLGGHVEINNGALLQLDDFDLDPIERDGVLDDIPTRELIRYLYDERGREIYDDVSAGQQMHILCAIAAEETSPNNIYNAETLKQALCEFVDKNARLIRFY